MTLGEKKTNKCNQCNYTSSQASHLKIHLKMHSEEKSNKCNQCDFAFSHAQSFEAHLKTHIGEKSNKCKQCDYASSHAGNLNVWVVLQFSSERSGLPPVWIWNRHPHPLIYVGGIKIQSHKTFQPPTRWQCWPPPSQSSEWPPCQPSCPVPLPPSLINCSLYIFDVFKTLECQLGVIKVSELIGLQILILKQS